MKYVNRRARVALKVLLASGVISFLDHYQIGELAIIARAFAAMGFMAFIGIVFFKILCDKQGKKNLLLSIGGGMIVGPLVFVFTLGILSYVFKGKIFLTIFFYLILLISAYLAKIRKIKLLDGFRSLNKLYFLVVFVIISLNIYLIYNLVNQSIIGGDASIYSAIAMSFTRGNYPTFSPWQPDYLAVYHHGTFMITGLLAVISSLQVDRMHSFFSFYLISAVFIFVSGLALQIKKSIFVFIPAVFGLVLWGFPTILLKPALGQNLLSVVSEWPTFNMISSISGTGAGSMQGAAYTIFTIFSLATFLLFVYLLSQKNINLRKKYLLLIILTAVNLSINETYFPIQVFLTVTFFIYEYWHIDKKIVFSSSIFLLAIFTALFLLIQNYIRDSLFTLSPYGSRTQILPLNWATVNSYFNVTLKDNLGPVNLNGSLWHIADIRLLIAATLILSIMLRKKIPFSFSISATLCIVLSIFVYSPFWNGVLNNLRYLNLSYQLTAFSIGFLFIYLLKHKVGRILSLILLIFALPQINSSYANAINIAQSNLYNYYTVTYAIDPDEEDIKRIDSLLAADERLLIVSFTSYGAINPQVVSTAIGKYGLFIPISSPDIRTPCPDRSLEWYDAVNDLDPISIKKLKIDYIYLDNSSNKYLSKQRLDQINNPTYFKTIFTSSTGRLVKATKTYFSDNLMTNNTTRHMLELVEDGKYVYVDRFDGNIEKPIVLNLVARTQLISNEYEIGQDYYLCNEAPVITNTKIKPQLFKYSTDGLDYFLSIVGTNSNAEGISKVDYAFLTNGTDANKLLRGRFVPIAQAQAFTFWKRI